MQSVSSRIWTRVAVFISYDDNNYTTGTSQTILLYTQLGSTTKNFLCRTKTMLPLRSLHNGHTTRQWKEACTINSPISPHWAHFDGIARHCKKSLLPIQMVLQITSMVSDVSSLLRFCIPTAFQEPTAAISNLPPSSCQAPPLSRLECPPHSLIFYIMHYLIMIRCQRDLSANEIRFLGHANIYSWKSTHFGAFA